jgi:hypothetical protein
MSREGEVPMRKAAVVFGTLVLVILGLSSCSKKTADPGAAGQKAGEASGGGAVSGAPSEARGRGWLEVQGADFGGHEIRKAGTAEKAAEVNAQNSSVPLEAGRYDVVFGQSLWKDVEVKAGETTRLVPGGITLVGASLKGHEVAAADTGVVQGILSSLKNSLTVVPGRYLVKFGPLDWPAEVAAGQTTTLKAGIVEVKGAHFQGHPIQTAGGVAVGDVSNIQSSLPLPPGDYVIEVDGQKLPFTLKEGERRTFERK